MTPPDPQGPAAQKSSAQKVALLIAAGCAISAPLAASFEGYVSRAQPDPVGIPTYCYGETNQLHYDPEHIYAKTECMALLRQRMQQDFAPKVLACLPELKTLPVVRARYIFGALIDGSYNGGPHAICISPMARAIHSYMWRAACNDFSGWFTTARDRRTGQRVTLRGLVRRRAAERQTCLSGA